MDEPEPPPITFVNAARPSRTISVAPLVDIVLLLISFYLIVAKSSADRTDPDVRVPVIASLEPQDMPGGALIINLRPDGSIHLDGESVTESALELHLARAVSQQSALSVGDDTEAQTPNVTIRADGRLRYANLQKILTLCRDQGITNLNFRAAER